MQIGALLCLPMQDKTRAKEANLTDENREESARLKALWEAAKSRRKLSQEAFGHEYGIGNQAAVWQCLNGRGMPISMKAALGFAKGLGVQVRDFSPRLADELERQLEHVAKPPLVDAFADWRLQASAKSLEVIQRLELMAQMNLLSEEDWALIDAFTLRFAKKG